MYERAIANLPPLAEKRYWRRYIYLWINYALFEELQAEDVQRTRQVPEGSVVRGRRETGHFAFKSFLIVLINRGASGFLTGLGRNRETARPA